MTPRFVALAVVLPIAAVWANSRQQTAQPPPIFRTGADIVEVDASVQDKSGRFATDLSVEDFELFEDGKPQRVELFYFASRGSVVPATIAPASADQASTIPSAARAPHAFIVVLDTDHLSPAAFNRVQAAARSLFAKHFETGDIGGVVANRQIANRRLTTDREELIQAVKNARPGFSSSSRKLEEQLWPRLSELEAVAIHVNDDRDILGEAIDRACAEDRALCDQADASVRSKAQVLATQVLAESRQSVQLIITLLNGLTGFKGRKTVVLFSEGFFAEEAWPLVQEAIGLAARANARVYTIDTRGSGRGLRSVDDLTPTFDTHSRMLAQMDPTSDAVNSLAVDTGGFAVRNTNAFDDAVARIAVDAGTYYVLGYRPSNEFDGKFHKISIKVNRPGVSVRARRGYVATPRTATLSASDFPRATPDPERETGAPNAAPVKAPTTSDTEMPAEPASAAVRLRPDVSTNVEKLGGNSTADAAARAGWEAYQRGDLESARKSLAVAATNPDVEAWVHYALGQSEYALGQFKDAARSWETVRQRAPDFEPVYFDLVDAYLQLKEQDVAIRVLRSAEQRWPNDSELFNALGVVQTSRGALDDAVKSFQQAIAKAPEDGIGYFNLAKALELRYNRSRRYVQQTRTWVASSTDHDAAIENYKRYLQIGGPFADSAREGLTRLQWTPK